MMKFPVFIVGSPRSGTSMLGNVLAAAGYQGFKEGLFLQMIHSIESLVDRNFDTFASEAKKKVLISNVNRDAFKSALVGVIKRTADRHNSEGPWFDKTCNPEMILSIPTIKRLWPSSVFIFAKRRGIENVASRMKKFPQHSFDYHCADWARNMHAWRGTREQLPPPDYIEVDQQELIKDCRSVAAKICGFLSLEAQDVDKVDTLLRSSRPQESELGSAAKLHTLESVGWTPQQLKTFETKCGAEMRKFGYLNDERYSLNKSVGVVSSLE